jgi:4-hydroxy-tetrahydrodipicolinate synthase
MSTPLRGIFNILATTFDAAQQVDFASLRHLVNFQLALGAHGLTILGVLGEAAKLSLDERRAVMDTVMETVAGRVPVVVGASHADRDARLALCRAAFAAGAAAVMVAPPRMDQSTDDAVIGLYADIAAAVDRPIVVQDFPPVNNVIMSPEMLARLAEQVPHCRTLKLEDPPLMEKVAAIRARTDKFAIFGGLGGMFLLEELARGAAGTMTGFAFTEVLVAIYDAFSQGRQADAETIFDLYLPLIRYENQPVVNLTIRKELLFRRGAIACPALRDPFAPIDAGTHDELTWILRRVGIEDPTRRLLL